MRLPRSEEALLDLEEARARFGIQMGLRRIVGDAEQVIDVRRVVRRHPLLAVGLGAVAGVALGFTGRMGVVARAIGVASGFVLRPVLSRVASTVAGKATSSPISWALRAFSSR